MSLRKYSGYYYSIIDSFGINNKIILTIQIFNYQGKIKTERISDFGGKNFPHDPKKLFMFKYNQDNQQIYSLLVSNDWYQVGYNAFPKKTQTYLITIDSYKKTEEKPKTEEKKRKIINGILIN